MLAELLLSRVAGRTWAALRENGTTVELRVGSASDLPAGTVLAAPVLRVVPSIQAAFLDVGAEHGGLLRAGDLALPGESGGRSVPIQDRLCQGRMLVVQVSREASHGKGPRLTSRIRFPGRYLLYAPGQRIRRIARRIEGEAARSRLGQLLRSLPDPEDGFVARSAARDASDETVRAEADALRSAWASVLAGRPTEGKGRILHAGPDLAMRMIRDLPSHGDRRIVIDDPSLLDRLSTCFETLEPGLVSSMVLEPSPPAALDRHGCWDEFREALRPTVSLPGGGSLVIETTEAFTAIDVNTGRSEETGDREDMARTTNLEAARETARQMRLRDLGGAVVVDFIEMRATEDRDRVVAALREATASDRERITVGPMSDNCLVELVRPRVRPSLESTLEEPCERCGGAGRLRRSETIAAEAMVRLFRILSRDPEASVSDVSILATAKVAGHLETLRESGAIPGAVKVVTLDGVDDEEFRIAIRGSD